MKDGFDAQLCNQKSLSCNRLSVVKSYCGHGIGDLFHCAPNVPHYSHNKVCHVCIFLASAGPKSGLCTSLKTHTSPPSIFDLQPVSDRHSGTQAVGVMKPGHVFSIEVGPHSPVFNRLQPIHRYACRSLLKHHCCML